MKKKEPQTELVKHSKSVKNKVAKAVVGTHYTIGSFYDEAATDKLKGNKLHFTEQQILDKMDDYREMLLKSPKVSETKYKHMEVAIVGCKFIINDFFKTPRKSEMSWG